MMSKQAYGCRQSTWEMEDEAEIKKKKTKSNTSGPVVGDRMGYSIRQMDLWLFMVACKG